MPVIPESNDWNDLNWDDVKSYSDAQLLVAWLQKEVSALMAELTSASKNSLSNIEVADIRAEISEVKFLLIKAAKMREEFQQAYRQRVPSSEEKTKMAMYALSQKEIQDKKHRLKMERIESNKRNQNLWADTFHEMAKKLLPPDLLKMLNEATQASLLQSVQKDDR